MRLPEELVGLDGLVLPGGESTTVGLVAERSGLMPALRSAVVEERLPTFGTCAGLIMLARETTEGAQPLVRAMDTTVRRNAWGRQVASFEADPDGNQRVLAALDWLSSQAQVPGGAG